MKKTSSMNSANLFVKVLSYIFLTCSMIYFMLQLVIFYKNPLNDAIYYLEKIGPGIWMFLIGIGLRFLSKRDLSKFFEN
jgi:sulfite exporter TauE/SafE